jgi:hypothetical protein
MVPPVDPAVFATIFTVPELPEMPAVAVTPALALVPTVGLALMAEAIFAATLVAPPALSAAAPDQYANVGGVAVPEVTPSVPAVVVVIVIPVGVPSSAAANPVEPAAKAVSVIVGEVKPFVVPPGVPIATLMLVARVVFDTVLGIANWLVPAVPLFPPEG